jgi:hypothetical protein
VAWTGNAAPFDAGRYDIPGSGDTNAPRDAYALMAPTAAPRGKVDPMEEFKVSGAALMEKLKELIHEGNVRRIILKNPEGRTLFDMPLNAGIAGMALLPFWAAVGAVAVLATDYAILVERDPEPPAAAAPAPPTA